MNHPRIDTKHLSLEAIKAIGDVLMTDIHRIKAERKKNSADIGVLIPTEQEYRNDQLLQKQGASALSQYNKIERFLEG